MLRRLTEWSVNNTVASTLLTVGLLIAGAISLMSIHRELAPRTETPAVEITVVWPGASPEQVESQIVVRLEDAINEVRGVLRVRAEATKNLGTVWVFGKSTVNAESFIKTIEREVRAISALPAGAERPKVSPFQTEGELLRIAVYGDVDDERLLKEAERIRGEIAALPGVPAARLLGERTREISIEASELAMRRYAITIDDIVSAIRRNSVDVSAGGLQSDRGEIRVGVIAQAKTLEDFRNIPVKQDGSGAALRVADFANIHEEFGSDSAFTTFRGAPAVFVQVIDSPDADVLEISSAVARYIADARSPDVHIEIWEDKTEIFRARLDVVTSSLLFGLILVLIALGLMLNLSIAVWVAFGIAVAFAGGVAFLPWFNVSLNMTSAFAFLLVIGVIVDDAIIVGESIHTRIEQGIERRKAAIDGAVDVARPVVLAALTTMLFFAPWIFMSGNGSAATRAISLVVILTLAASLFEALLLLPAHLAASPAGRVRKMRHTSLRVSRAIHAFAGTRFRRIAETALRRRYLVIALFLSVFIAAIGMVRTGAAPVVFVPHAETSQIMMVVRMPRGASPDRMRNALAQIEQTSARAEAAFNAKFGAAIPLFLKSHGLVHGENAVLFLLLPPPNDRAETVEKTVDRLRSLLPTIDNAEKITVRADMHADGPALQLILNSDEPLALNAAATDLMERLRAISGVYDVDMDMRAPARQAVFSLKPGARALGFSTEDAARQIRQAVFGEEVQRLPRESDETRVVVRLEGAKDTSLGSLRRMRMRTADGQFVPFDRVFEIEFRDGTEKIIRRDRRRAVTVTAETDAANLGAVYRTLYRDFFSNLSVNHPTVQLGLGGRAQEQQVFVNELFVLSFAAISLAYFLIAVAFRSFFEPLLIIFVAVPFCFSGAVFSHAMLNLPLSMFSLLGVMAASGVAINDNLLLIDRVKQLERGPFRAAIDHLRRRAGGVFSHAA